MPNGTIWWKDPKNEQYRKACFTDTRNVFQIFNVNCATFCMSPEYLTTTFDETLWAYWWMAKLKQYNSDKPAKYGPLSI